MIPFQVYFSIFGVHSAVLQFTKLGFPGFGGRIVTGKRIINASVVYEKVSSVTNNEVSFLFSSNFAQKILQMLADGLVTFAMQFQDPAKQFA